MSTTWSLLSVLVLFGAATECCFSSKGSSSSSGSSSSGSSSAQVHPTNGPSVPYDHKDTCNYTENWSANCLNGGECFVVTLNGVRRSYCSCTPQWVGIHCESVYFAYETKESNSAQIGVIVGVILGVVAIVTVVIVVFLCYRQRHPKPRRPITNGNTSAQNGAAPTQQTFQSYTAAGAVGKLPSYSPSVEHPPPYSDKRDSDNNVPDGYRDSYDQQPQQPSTGSPYNQHRRSAVNARPDSFNGVKPRPKSRRLVQHNGNNLAPSSLQTSCEKPNSMLNGTLGTTLDTSSYIGSDRTSTVSQRVHETSV